MRRYITFLDCWDPHAEHHPLPTYPWRHAPLHLFTRRQLREAGLSPGHPPVAQMLRPRKRRPTKPLRAWLYDGYLAVPKRQPTPAQLAAVEAMNRARRTCPTCQRDVGYRIPTSPPCHGECLDCAAVAGRIDLPNAA